MFVGSDRDGDGAAIFYTLIETAKLNSGSRGLRRRGSNNFAIGLPILP
jgi:hypothetical protein